MKSGILDGIFTIMCALLLGFIEHLKENKYFTGKQLKCERVDIFLWNKDVQRVKVTFVSLVQTAFAYKVSKQHF